MSKAQHDVYINYKVKVVGVGEVPQMARTEWEAIDKVYTKHSSVQSDRNKYTIVKQSIKIM